MQNLLKELSNRNLLPEGVHDQGILKAIFLAGGPGSGKSHITNQIFGYDKNSISSYTGLKKISSDIEFEYLMKKHNVSSDLRDPEIFKKLTNLDDPNSLRYKAKALSNKKENIFISNKLGLIIDGTGKNYDNTKNFKEHLEKNGYDCAMIFVNTSLEIAKYRNNSRTRKLPDAEVEQMWNSVQNNLGKFQSMFGNNFFIVDNNNTKTVPRTVLKKIAYFLREPIKNPIGKKWIKDNLK
jgi:predicted kinase